MTFALTLFLALFITLGAVPLLRRLAERANIMDIPDERKVHSKPIPKIGGLAMALGFFVPTLLWLDFSPFVIALLISTAMLVAAGCADDIFNLGYKPKFLAQIIAALVIMLYGGIQIRSLGMLLPEGVLLPGFIALPLTLVVIVGITNAINLADGLDGLAGGLTLMTFLCLCALAYQSGDYTVLFVCMVMLGALVGFLNYNTYPATVFMGDAGSQTLGFIAIVLSIKLTQESAALSPLLPILLVGFPIIDTLEVMLERARKGRSLFVADNNHFHHKLLKLNLYHTEAVFIIYLLQSALVLSAFLLRFYSDWVILAAFVLFAGAIVAFFQITHATNFTFKRSFQGFKVKLRFFKDRALLLRLAGIPLVYVLPVLLLANCCMVDRVPPMLAWLAAGLAFIILALWIARFNKLSGVLRAVLYFCIPAVIYIRPELPNMLWGINLRPFYPALFILCLVSALMVIRYDRRKTGFKPSPMDYLILLLALIAPTLLAPVMDVNKTRAFMVQVLIFLYCYEIMLDRRRLGYNVVAITTIGALIIVAAKGLV